ncbi:ABC transporter substrate-binding protein [Haloechinothrix halophila]|uniref:ABC transporter substrate-binding protein n=1 Tax=Haloechinothrix halophila TaxID=1069073 RepID=UPI0004143F0C|nr:ABC transporter substrate-binding protein [Haloechinothrix halophila]
MRPARILAPALAAAAVLSACSTAESDTASGGDVTVTNCGEEVSFPSPAERLFVNDGNMISMVLALGAQDQVAAVSSVQRDAPVLRKHYGDAVDGLNDVAKTYPSRETVLAQRPDVVVAGWNYGYDETKKLTPASLAQHDIDAYTLTESCRQGAGSARGIVDPWTALRTDLRNLGQITGRQDRADEVVADLDERLTALEDAPEPEEPPTIFLFDSGDKTIYSSGNLGAPQAIITAGGGRNALEDLKDTWTEVSWERLASAEPDAILFVDYPPQTFEEKVRILREHAATKDLEAVREERFLNLPYALWTSGPLNIDAAEQVRAALEGWDLVPDSGIAPKNGSDAVE